MSAFADTAFATTAFAETAFDFGTGPVVVAADPSGGFFFGFDHARARREKRKRELAEMAAEQQSIEDAQAREIAQLLHAQEAKDAEREDLARLQALADKFAKPGNEVPRALLATVMKAHEERTKNALEQLQREFSRMLEDEEAAVIAMLMMDD